MKQNGALTRSLLGVESANSASSDIVPRSTLARPPQERSRAASRVGVTEDRLIACIKEQLASILQVTKKCFHCLLAVAALPSDSRFSVKLPQPSPRKREMRMVAQNAVTGYLCKVPNRLRGKELKTTVTRKI